VKYDKPAITHGLAQLNNVNRLSVNHAPVSEGRR